MAKGIEPGAPEPVEDTDDDKMDPKHIAAIQTAVSHLEQAATALSSIDPAMAEHYGVDDIQEELETQKEALTDIIP